MICTHEGRGSVHKPLPWFLEPTGFSWHVLNADTIPPKKQTENQKKEQTDKKELETAVKELPQKDAKPGEVIRIIKQVPKAKKQPKPVAVQTPQLPVKIPVIKPPKVIKKIRL
ncbi:MAG TPA: hypothetical protein VM488_16765 [Pseudobacter sp.]|nr:hypothetical protein [Pseudobacter sp.]